MLDNDSSVLILSNLMLSLESGQFKVLADFFSDLAKGLILAAVIGQGFVSEISGLARAIFSIFWITFACVSLYLALYFSKEVKS